MLGEKMSHIDDTMLKPKRKVNYDGIYVMQGSDEECALYVFFIDKNKRHSMICLNKYAAEIWNLLDGKNSIRDIVMYIATKYKLRSDYTYTEIKKLLDALNARGLIEWV